MKNINDVIDYLNEVMDCDDVPIRLRHAALGLKLSIIKAIPKEPEIVYNNKIVNKVCNHFYKTVYIGVGYVRQCKICGDIKQ